MLSLCLWGCQTTPQTPTIQLKEHVTLLFFYTQTCPVCKSFKKNAIPYLEETFGDAMTIEKYDLDEDATAPIYDQVIDSLVDFDESQYGYGPFYAVKGYFAKLGYTEGDEEELAKDISKAVNHQELGYELEAERFLYKES